LNIPKMELGQAVQFEWSDSKSLLGWTYGPKMKRTPGRISTLGYFVQSNEECLTVSTTMDFRGASLDDLSVPIGCITRLTVLPGDFKCPLVGKEE
jgi:hypothetical protein